MYGRSPTLLCAAFVLAGCGHDPAETVIPDPSVDARPVTAPVAGGLVPRSIPDEDPGPPFYARVGVQFFHDGGWLAIPFYRAPDCVPADFNLLDFFHFPGPSGPGAFACPFLMTGTLLIEPDAPQGTFPRQAVLAGSDIPFWFVPSASFEAGAADGVVTLAELASMPLVEGIADRFAETLHPREDDHKIVIDASGLLEDGRGFRFHVTHIADEVRSIRIAFE